MFAKCYFRCWRNSSAQDNGPALGELSLVLFTSLLFGFSTDFWCFHSFDYRNKFVMVRVFGVMEGSITILSCYSEDINRVMYFCFYSIAMWRTRIIKSLQILTF